MRTPVRSWRRHPKSEPPPQQDQPVLRKVSLPESRDAKPKAQKVLNIRRNPKVGVMIETGGIYARFRGVMLRDVCEIIEDPEAVARTMRDSGAIGARVRRRRRRRAAPPSGWC